MTSVNKVVQANVNFKPWMFKNTNDIVNAYVQKIYKQMPASFNKGVKTVRVASPRPENRAPLSTFTNQQRQLPSAGISPRTAAKKKSHSMIKQQSKNLMKLLNISKKNNTEISQKVGTDKRLVKTANYKIYKSQRYGSSSSTSRSSLFRRHDERRRQRATFSVQNNYLIRALHTSKFEPTYARFLMPARNQQRDTKFGSLPDAIEFSNNMLQDLIKIDKPANVVEVATDNSEKKTNLNQESRQLPDLSKYKIKFTKESAIKQVTPNVERLRRMKLSTEQRDYARLNVGCSGQLKHPKPPQELFTAQHDRNKTELHEKHRRNRMKKLGLIGEPGIGVEVADKQSLEAGEKSEKHRRKRMKKLGLIKSPTPTATDIKVAAETSAEVNKQSDLQFDCESRPLALRGDSSNKSVPKLCNQGKVMLKAANSLLPPPLKKATSLCIKPKTSLISAKGSVKPKLGFINSPTLMTSISPIVAARAQMPNRLNLGSYRYNRSDFFSTKKY